MLHQKRTNAIRKEPLSRLLPRAILTRLNLDLFIIDRYVSSPEFPFDDRLYRIITFAEDRRFNSHLGVDFRSIIREFLRLVTTARMYGASTIDMQFVRTCLNRRERTAARKITEIILAILINFRYSKEEIFASYMRYAYFGYKLTGLDEALHALFGEGYDQLDDEKMCLVTSCLVFPIPKNRSEKWRNKVAARQKMLLSRLRTHKKQFQKIPSIKPG